MIKDELNEILDLSFPYKPCTIELIVKISSRLEKLFDKYNLNDFKYRVYFGKAPLDRTVILEPLNEMSQYVLKGIMQS